MKAETNRNAFRRARTRTLASTRSAFFASCLVRIEAWRTVSPCLHPARLSERMRNFRQARYGIGFSIPYRGCVRPTSATYCLSNRQPAFSVLVSRSGLRHSRDEEPDVSRRPSSLRPDRRFSMGFVAPGLTSLHVSRERNTFRSWPLTPLSPRRGLAPPSQAIYEPHVEAKVACYRHPVKDVGGVTTQGAFLR